MGACERKRAGKPARVTPRQRPPFTLAGSERAHPWRARRLKVRQRAQSPVPRART